MKANLGPVLKRFDATLQFGGALRVRSDSRAHGQSFSFCSKEHIDPPRRCSFALAV
jgi:hypothetical protein